jgi:tight adherence protein C
VTWIVAASYVAAGWLLVCAVGTRVDPRVARALAQARGEHGETPGWIATITRRLPLARSRHTLSVLVASSGVPPEVIEQALAWKLFLAAAGGILGLSAGPPPGLLAVPVLGMAGYRLPDFILARRASRIRSRGAALVPDLLDVVAVCVTAGLTPRLALDRAALSVGEPLRQELARARRDVGLGGTWRQALLGIADRSGLEEVRRLASVIERSERLGTPVAGPLRELAGTVRAERRAREEERARRAPVTMLFPLVFLILPAFVLAAVVPAILVATRGVQ